MSRCDMVNVSNTSDIDALAMKKSLITILPQSLSVVARLA